MTQDFCTIALPFDPSRRQTVEQALDELGNPAGKAVRDALRPDRVVHFMSASVVHGDPGKPDHLVFEMSTDGGPDLWQRLIDGPLEPFLDPVVTACGAHYSDSLFKFLEPRIVKTGQGLMDRWAGLNFCGAPGMTAKRIYAENQLVRDIRTFFDKTPPTGDPLDIVNSVRAHIAKDPDNAPMLEPEPVPVLAEAPPSTASFTTIPRIALAGILKFLWPVLLLAALVTAYNHWETLGGIWHDPASPSGAEPSFWSGVVLPLLCVLWAFALNAILFVLLAAIILLLLLLRLENANEPDDSLPDQAILADAVSREDQERATVYNHLTGISRMQPGLLRELTLRIAFWLILQLAVRAFRLGFLGELGTIHFARWVRLPGTNRLVFLSNYGGSWESYLEDFITKAANGLTGAWSNTAGFPRTRLLFFRGATDGDRFKRWARRQQIPTRLWYAANPSVSTSRIRSNAAIRNGLARVSTHDEAQQWLTLFGSRSRPAREVEKGEIQTLVFRGFGDHPVSTALMFQLPAQDNQARAWLREVMDKVGFGPDAGPAQAEQLALTARGLEILGLRKAEMEQFSLPFRQGMDDPHRRRILADTGDDKPELWHWGHGDRAVDGIWMIYGADEKALKSALDQAVAALDKHGGSEIYRIRTALSRKTRREIEKDAKIHTEPFGFADGISQPVVNRLRPRSGTIDRNHLIEPGEVVLGYPDNRGETQFGVRVAATRDPGNLLPAADSSSDRETYPAFAVSGANADRDLSRNGSYLVVRQLTQDVKKFEKFIKGAAKTIATDPSLPPNLDTPEKREHYVGAKMVGRWRDGTSLVRYPNKPGNDWAETSKSGPAKLQVPPDNDFLHGEEDPAGDACPFGSHIRRANPRDSFVPGSAEQIAITNRHRILRRGRFYDGAENPGMKKDAAGLLFACVNADIERQFEFVQQTWSMARQFHGLDSEVDPILGRGETMGRLTIPTPRGPIQVKGVADFVTVAGGAYFFLPGKRMLRFLSDL